MFRDKGCVFFLAVIIGFENQILVAVKTYLECFFRRFLCGCFIKTLYLTSNKAGGKFFDLKF